MLRRTFRQCNAVGIGFPGGAAASVAGTTTATTQSTPHIAVGSRFWSHSFFDFAPAEKKVLGEKLSNGINRHFTLVANSAKDDGTGGSQVVETSELGDSNLHQLVDQETASALAQKVVSDWTSFDKGSEKSAVRKIVDEAAVKVQEGSPESWKPYVQELIEIGNATYAHSRVRDALDVENMIQVDLRRAHEIVTAAEQRLTAVWQREPRLQGGALAEYEQRHNEWKTDVKEATSAKAEARIEYLLAEAAMDLQRENLKKLQQKSSMYTVLTWVVKHLWAFVLSFIVAFYYTFMSLMHGPYLRHREFNRSLAQLMEEVKKDHDPALAPTSRSSGVEQKAGVDKQTQSSAVPLSTSAITEESDSDITTLIQEVKELKNSIESLQGGAVEGTHLPPPPQEQESATPASTTVPRQQDDTAASRNSQVDTVMTWFLVFALGWVLGSR